MGNKENLEALGIDLNGVHNKGKVKCPKCSHTRKNKNDPCLSVDVLKGQYNCWNDSCDFHGTVAKHPYQQKPTQYLRPSFVNTTPLNEKWVNWFFERGITQRTLNECKLTQSLAMDGSPVINFNYFRGGELINVKYRSGDKRFRMEKNAELIFYGLDDIEHSDWCVIVEGEIDRLSFVQVGIKECVSVPNGASKSSNVNLEYLDNCIEYFTNKTKIIIATDADEAGKSLREELARRLGHERCFMVDFKGCKDANEYLVQYGAEELKMLISHDRLIEYPISGIITASMVWSEMEDFFKNGLNRGATTNLLLKFDKLVSFEPGQFMVLTGIPNHGKSQMALLIMASLSIAHGWKWGVFSAENRPLTTFIAKICELLIGRRMRPGIGFTERETALAKAFINEHFFFIEPEDSNHSLDNILEKAKLLVTRKGIKGLIIDPWNKLEHNIPKGEQETLYISRELDKIIRFNQRNSVFSIVVAHPTKIRKDPKTNLFEVPNLYDIAGSSNWFNKPDIGITFYRDYHLNTNIVHVQKMRYDHLGSLGNCELKFNINNGRFSDHEEPWDNSNWLIVACEQVSLFESDEEGLEVPF